MSKCMEKGHKYQKFDDTSLFCERCGERKFIAADWTYRPYPYTWPWYVTPWVVNPYTITTSGTSLTDASTYELRSWDDVPHTLTDGSES